MRSLDLNRLDIASLLVALEDVPDPRKRRGVRHDVPQILIYRGARDHCGANSPFAIGELARELPEEALRRLGSRVSPTTRTRVAPEESTIQRMLKAVDADPLDRVLPGTLDGRVDAVDPGYEGGLRQNDQR